MVDQYGRVGVYQLHFFPMDVPFGVAEQLVVYDRTISAFRVVQHVGDGWMVEECGRRYHREHCSYEMWAPLDKNNLYQEETS